MECALFGQTDIGAVRKNNEDDFCLLANATASNWQEVSQAESIALAEWGAFMAVADGMGGANAGEVASRIAVETFRNKIMGLGKKPALPSEICDLLRFWLLEAHHAIAEKSLAQQEHRGMGTTGILAWVCDGKVHLAWSGDSRCYLWNAKAKSLRRLSKDHSYVQEMIDLGLLFTEEDARKHPKAHIITQSLGDVESRPHPESAYLNVNTGDILLLCSDGLNTMLTDTQIKHVLQANTSLQKAGAQLIQQANALGGLDNITVCLLQIKAIKERAASPKKTWKLW